VFGYIASSEPILTVEFNIMGVTDAFVFREYQCSVTCRLFSVTNFDFISNMR
jgi:hypothetical protein